MIKPNGKLSLAIWIPVFVMAFASSSPTAQENDGKLSNLKQSLLERENQMLQMRYLIKMIRDPELQAELEIVPAQIAEMEKLVGEFQQSQIRFTIKNGDRQQDLNRLIKEGMVADATDLADEMFSEFDLSMLSLNKKVKKSILPHQLKRLQQISTQQRRMSRTPFRDEFGVALAIVAELDLPKREGDKTAEKIANIRGELLNKIEQLRQKAREEVVRSFPKEHQGLIKDVYTKYYDPEKNRRLASEKRFKDWNNAR